MARPKNADAAATRGRILAAARSLFAEQGLGGTSTRDIARTAGVSVATLHHHFGNKAALHEAATNELWSGTGSVHKAFMHAIDDDDDLPTLVDKCIRVAFAHARQERDSVRLLLRNLVQGGATPDPMTPFVKQASTLVAAATGRRERTVRLELSSVVFLIMRYALTDGAEIATLLDIDLKDTDEDALIDALENHLVRTSMRVLAIERDGSDKTNDAADA